jgi:hypothetical protein
MSRRAVDPVERAFAVWVALSNDEQQRFEDRRAGYRAAMGPAYAPPKPRRKRKEVAAGGEQ